MFLVDTSVWIDFLRCGRADLAARLADGAVACHPFVLGELACGTLRNRAEILGLLRALPTAAVAANDEVLAFIELHELQGRGLGWVDMHLLASARLEGVPLWTLDRKLAAAADELGVGVP